MFKKYAIYSISLSAIALAYSNTILIFPVCIGVLFFQKYFIIDKKGNSNLMIQNDVISMLALYQVQSNSFRYICLFEN